MTLRATLKRIPPVDKTYRAVKFLAFQARLRYSAWKDERNTPSRDGIPLPPGKLRYRVHGDLDAANFQRTGRVVAANIAELMQKAGHPIGEFASILDFGCGCGRVLAHLAATRLPAQFAGCDIDPEAIEWCAANLAVADWRVNGFQPPLPWPNETFDFVFSISVFTHLDRDMQDRWLSELRRVTRSGGLLLLTVHGEFVHQTLPADQQAALRRDGFLYVSGTTGRFKLDGLPDFYQTAFHTSAFINETWNDNFDVLAVVPRGINNHQDAVILRRR